MFNLLVTHSECATNFVLRMKNKIDTCSTTHRAACAALKMSRTMPANQQKNEMKQSASMKGNPHCVVLKRENLNMGDKNRNFFVFAST